MTHRSVEVPVIARVEGEGALHVAVDDGEITDLRLEIYEPPRFFEAFLAGPALPRGARHRAEDLRDLPRRLPDERRSTGSSACSACEVPEGTHELRRLLYCGEWIESHVLHIFLLAAPDFLGFANAIEMATEHPELVKRALEIKRIGNDLMAAIGGREIHPVSPRVGGFSQGSPQAGPRAVPAAAGVGARRRCRASRTSSRRSRRRPSRDRPRWSRWSTSRSTRSTVGDMASTNGRRWEAAELRAGDARGARRALERAALADDRHRERRTSWAR